MHRVLARRWVVAQVAALSGAGLVRTVDAVPLDPGSFTSLGTMNLTSGSVTINTDTLGITGAATFNGGTISQGAGNPEVAVFTFTNFNIGAGVTVNVTGSRPLALLSQGTMSIASAINLNGGNGGVPTAGAAGPAGGYAGGTGGLANSPGSGPGGGTGTRDAGGGGFGGAGGIGYRSTIAGASYGNLLSLLQGGSGGGGAKASDAGGGGGGGGAVELGSVGTLLLTSSLTSNGGGAGDLESDGGGGAGGGILLHAGTITFTSLSAAGGHAGINFSSGGGGGGGRIALVGGSLTASSISTQITSLSNSVNGGPISFLGTPGKAGVLSFRPDLATVQSTQSLNVGITPGQTGRTDPRIEVLPKSLTVQSGGTATLISPISWESGGSVAVTGGVLTVNSDTTFTTGSSLNVSAGTFNLPAGRQMSFTGATGTITPDVTFGGTINLSSSSLTLGGNTTFSTGSNLTWNSGNVIVAAGKTLTIDGGVVNVSQSGRSVTNGSTLRVASAGKFSSAFAFDVASTSSATGSLNVDGSGSLFEVYGSFGRIAPNAGNAATVNLSNSAHAHYDAGLQVAASGGTALVNISSNASLSTANLIVGRATPGSVATINLNGGSLISYGPVAFREGVVVNYSAGALSAGGTLVTSGNAQVLLSTGGNKVLRTTGLNMSGTSKIDLADNDMIINWLTPLATVQGYILTGRNGGNWMGNALTSSAAALDPTHKGLGVVDNAVLGLTTFSGQTVDASSILVKYTYLGDANLDGKVNTVDFNNLAGNFGGSGKVWLNGDFDYDGLVSSTDFNLLAGNFGRTLAPAAPLSGPQLGSIVPEPMTAMIVFPAVALSTRHKRRFVRDPVSAQP